MKGTQEGFSQLVHSNLPLLENLGMSRSTKCSVHFLPPPTKMMTLNQGKAAEQKWREACQYFSTSKIAQGYSILYHVYTYSNCFSIQWVHINNMFDNYYNENMFLEFKPASDILITNHCNNLSLPLEAKLDAFHKHLFSIWQTCFDEWTYSNQAPLTLKLFTFH